MDRWDVNKPQKSPLAFKMIRVKIPTMPTLGEKKGNVKARALRMVREMPKSSSWDDVMYRIYVRQKIEAGLADLADGRTHPHEAVRREFGVA